MTIHGGDVWQVAEELRIHPSDLIDFSANVNPAGLPSAAQERLTRDAANPDLLKLYPDPTAPTLRQALSRELGVPPEAVVIGPGAESLLSPALRCLAVQRALAPIPAFSEYRRVCAQQQVEFTPFPLERADCFRIPTDRLCTEIATARFGVVFLNNPHNPSGSLLEADEVRRIVAAATEAGTAVLLDEAFIDYAARATLASEAAASRNLIVFRSLTKFYGCPALRIGYAIAHPDTARAIASHLPTWPVTELAIGALTVAIAQQEYAEASLRTNARERAALQEALTALGLTVFPSAANYLLLELQPGMPPAAELRMRMVTVHQILIRNCDSYEGPAPGRYVRVAVRSSADNVRLTQALGEELNRP